MSTVPGNIHYLLRSSGKEEEVDAMLGKVWSTDDKKISVKSECWQGRLLCKAKLWLRDVESCYSSYEVARSVRRVQGE